MYARLIRLTFGEDVTHDEAHALYKELSDECRQVEGFRGCTFLLMPNARRGLTVTYWADAERATEAGERVLPTMLQRMSGLLAEAPEITGYEVIEQFMLDSHAG